MSEFDRMGVWRGRLSRVWERWKVIAHVIGNFQARVLLSLLYYFELRIWGIRNPQFIRALQEVSFT